MSIETSWHWGKDAAPFARHLVIGERVEGTACVKDW